LLQESHDLAAAADDLDLLYRCYVNLSSTQLNSGYPLHQPSELLERATIMARRSAAYGTLTFVLDNYAGLSWLRGRFEDAVEQADEAMDAADRAGYHTMKGTIHRVRAESLSALGRVDEAAADLAIAVARAADDPQHTDWLKVAVARSKLEHDPDAAVATLRGPHPEFEGYANADMTVTLWLGRIAYRVGDQEALAEALETHVRLAHLDSPGYVLERRWVRALADEDADALVSVSEAFADIGYALYAAEALVDAALVEARQAGEGQLARRAAAAVEALGYRPTLGPMPETRWVKTREVSAV
jgi:tetratricopeptide (TPR) repeat protein